LGLFLTAIRLRSGLWSQSGIHKNVFGAASHIVFVKETRFLWGVAVGRGLEGGKKGKRGK